MDILSGELTFLTKSGEEKEIKFSSEKRKEITCGSAPVCDIRIYEDVSDHQFRIYKNECGKVCDEKFRKYFDFFFFLT